MRNINRPVPPRPAPGMANGQAVQVVPDSGYNFTTISSESHAVARRFKAQMPARPMAVRSAAMPLRGSKLRAEHRCEAFSQSRSPRPSAPVGAGPNVLSFGRFQNADEIAAALA